MKTMIYFYMLVQFLTTLQSEMGPYPSHLIPELQNLKLSLRHPQRMRLSSFFGPKKGPINTIFLSLMYH